MRHLRISLFASLGFFLVGCYRQLPEVQLEHDRTVAENIGENPPPQPTTLQSLPALEPKVVSEPTPLKIDLGLAEKLVKENRFDELLDMFTQEQIESIPVADRKALAIYFYQAAEKVHQVTRDIPYASFLCERGLMLDPDNQELLRLQVRNYLHPDLRVYSGAEELADRLLQLDPENQKNQLLRGKVAFEQAEWDLAITWLEKAARAGRTEQSPEVKEAWKLLDLARAKAEEIRSSLSMTMELERRLALAREDIRKKMQEVAKLREQEELENETEPVVLYLTSWCIYCRKARQLLKDLNVDFVEKDIEKDPDAARELMQFAAFKGIEVSGVPVIKIGNELVVGFNADRIKMLIGKKR